MPGRAILLFDGVCNLCNHTVQLVIRIDRKSSLKFAALQSETGQHLLHEFQLSTTDLNTFVFIKDDKVYTRSTAVLHVFQSIGGPWKLTGLFFILPRVVRDAIYNFIARYRYRIFGKKEHCMVPSSDIMERFLP